MAKSNSSPKKSDSGTVDGRYRNWACVVYPDSAPANWLDIIAESKTPCMISPLHDSDTNPTGEPKKPHWHVLTPYEGKKSSAQAEDFFKSFGGVGCEKVNSLRGYARYLCHLDNPEKHQYDTADVKCFGGVDFFGCIDLPVDKYNCIREMMDFCSANSIYAYSDLLEYASTNRLDWFRILCDSGTVVMKEYLKSRSWKANNHFYEN